MGRLRLASSSSASGETDASIVLEDKRLASTIATLTDSLMDDIGAARSRTHFEAPGNVEPVKTASR